MVEDNEFEVRSSNTSQRKIDAGDVRRLEAYVNLFQEKIDSVKDNISELTSRIESLEAKKKKANLRDALLYIIIFGATALFTAYLVAKGKTQTPEVSIIYNVGDIIGGFLVGVAAVLSGFAYVRSRRE